MIVVSVRSKRAGLAYGVLRAEETIIVWLELPGGHELSELSSNLRDDDDYCL